MPTLPETTTGYPESAVARPDPRGRADRTPAFELARQSGAELKNRIAEFMAEIDRVMAVRLHRRSVPTQ
ncbi:MAG: hypothetical protein FJ280_13335 [Planctomycetes bacterium]|nr:hypothetical protein [Planctomycetota bacterium]